MHAVIRRIGNSKGLILPANLLEALALTEGSRVRIGLENGRVVIERVGAASLEEKLARFDPAVHGGEAMATAPAGLEKLP